MNRDFPAKRAKYWNIHIIKTTASYHNQILQSDRDPQVLTVVSPNMPQTNPRWRTAAISKNWKILLSSQPIDQFWQNLVCWCVFTVWTPVTNKFRDFPQMTKRCIKHSINSEHVNNTQSLNTVECKCKFHDTLKSWRTVFFSNSFCSVLLDILAQLANLPTRLYICLR